MRVYAELMFIPVMVLVAYFLYRFFEEPVRKLMLGDARHPVQSRARSRPGPT